MKKRINGILAIMLVFGLFFAACDEEQETYTLEGRWTWANNSWEFKDDTFLRVRAGGYNVRGTFTNTSTTLIRTDPLAYSIESRNDGFLYLTIEGYGHIVGKNEPQT